MPARKPERADEPVGQVDALRVPRFVGLRTFARLPPLEQVGRADVAVLGAPFDGAATFRAGARFGPAAIREASLLLRPYNEVLGVAPFASVQVADAGDAPASPIGVDDAHRAIEGAAVAVVEAGGRVLGLGGDHSVSLPLLRAAAGRHGALSLLQLDAHTDTWDSYFGSRYTHGTVFRRALEEGLIDGGSSVQVGLRGSLYAADDAADNRDLGFRTMWARELDRVGVAGALELAKEHLRSPLCVTVDIDVLDLRLRSRHRDPGGGWAEQPRAARAAGRARRARAARGRRGRGGGLAALRPRWDNRGGGGERRVRAGGPARAHR
jgi:agmatinase